MSELFEAFGLDWRLLVINLVNFGALLALLWYFLYGPLVRMLEERRERIAAGVRDADAARARLEQIEAARADALAQAGKEADDLLAQARSSAAAKERELVGAAESAAAALLRDAEAGAAELRSQAIVESKEEVAKLIVLGMERMMTKK